MSLEIYVFKKHLTRLGKEKNANISSWIRTHIFYFQKKVVLKQTWI